MAKTIEVNCATCGDKLIGNKYGDLTIAKILNKKNNGYKCLCICDCKHENCKKEINVVFSKLKNGKVKSCGAWYYTENIIGRKIHSLTCLKKSKKPGNWYLFKCDCGHKDCHKLTEKKATEVLNGSVKSCGVRSKRYVKDLTGEKFGRLTVVRRNTDKSKGSVFWDCICDCGNKVVTRGKYLKNGDTQSCGCLQKESISKMMYRGGRDKVWYDDYANRLLPIEETRRDPKNKKILQVRCTYCGKWYTPTRREVRGRSGYIEGDKWSGENRFYCCEDCKKQCPIYGQVKFPKDFQINSSREVQPELRQLVFKRDNYKCQKCESTKGLHCHHIEGLCWEPIESADIDKCMTLCKKCHKEVHKKDGCRYIDLQCKDEFRVEKTKFISIFNNYTIKHTRGGLLF